MPADVTFATKPALARTMIARALDAGVRAAWVAGDEVYGADPGLRRELETRGAGYVLAVACSHRVTTAAGPQRADALGRRLPRRAWQRLSAGQGSKGHRFHDWAWIAIDPGTAPVGHRSLLIRRSIRTGELAYYRCYSAAPAPLAALVAVAGRRWTVEESFQAGNGLAGLDQHQVRRWNSWHRWTILAMLALAFLAVLAAIDRREPPPDGMIPLTPSEIHHLLSVLLPAPARDARHWLRWSAWRRAHQHRARLCHYQKRAHPHHDHDLRLPY